MSRRSLQNPPGSSTAENALSYSLDRLNGLETAAVKVLNQAVEMDTSRRYLEALTCYREGLGILMDIVRNTNDDVRKQKFRVRMEEYMNRAEKLKILIEREKRAGSFHESFRIPDHGTGYSYERLLGPLLDEEITHIDVEDPYIRLPHQLLNFLRFCEVVVRSAPNLKSITLTTGQAQDEQKGVRDQQESALESLTKSFASRSVSLTVSYSPTLHDREIRFNNGWIIKIGRGLDYFKPVPKFSLGYCEMELRPCHETTVDIFHKTPASGCEQTQNTICRISTLSIQKSASGKSKPKVRFDIK